MSVDLLRLEKLSRTDRQRAAEMLAAAFAEDHLITEHYFPGVGRRSHEYLVYLMAYALNHGLLYGEVYATSAHYEGLAIWYPPAYSGPSAWKDVRAGGISLLLKTGAQVVRRMNDHLAYSIHLFSEHARRTHLAKGQYWYLWILAVAPEHQKKGYASKLVRPMLSTMDQEGHFCYLDTQNEDNLAMYGHYGFQIAETGQIPGTDIPHWLLKREPGGISS